MDEIEIVYGDIKFIHSFHKALSYVASERIYIEMIEAPPVEKVAEFQENLILKNGPVFYAMRGSEVVGWCDVFLRVIQDKAIAVVWEYCLNIEAWESDRGFLKR